VRVDELDELIEDGFLNEAFLVDGGGEVLEVDGALDGLAQLADEAHVDVGFEKGGANLFEHRVECLGAASQQTASSRGRRSS